MTDDASQELKKCMQELRKWKQIAREWKSLCQDIRYDRRSLCEKIDKLKEELFEERSFVADRERQINQLLVEIIGLKKRLGEPNK